MERFLAEFDPLAAMEADYAAVIARTPTPTDNAGAEPSTSKEDENPAHSDQEEEEEEEEEEEGTSMYAQLPTSPAGSGSDDGFDDDGEGQEDNQREPAQPISPVVAPMDATTKQTIMDTMKRIHLAPPPWMKDAASAISDDQLIELVQKRLHIQTASPPAEQ